MMRRNQTDEVSDAIRAITDQYAPDYCAPALTAALCRVARQIGLGASAVTEQIERYYRMLNDLELTGTTAAAPAPPEEE